MPPPHSAILIHVKFSKRRIILLATVWALLVLIWPSSTQLPSEVDPKVQDPKLGEGLYKSVSTKANFGLVGVRYYEAAEGRKHWHIESKYAELHRKENYAFLTEVLAEFFSKNTGNVVTTQSQYGRSWNDKNLIELEGDVKIRSKKGYLFEMDKMLYKSAKHEFTSEDRVRMRGPQANRPTMLLSGTGLQADIDREEFLLQRKVNAERKMKGSGALKIVADSGQFFTHESRSVFLGNVHAKMPSTEIESDVFELSMDRDDEIVAASGNVRLKNRGRVATAESALIELNGNEVILEGKARIDSEDNRIEGRKIRIYTDDDRIDVEEASGSVEQ
ncbi:LPS export ABC transporter periplasmic protein LptC [bacterium]|nr:LPS export ABC transporter periplasmic protein LptC [bacterium]